MGSSKTYSGQAQTIHVKLHELTKFSNAGPKCLNLNVSHMLQSFFPVAPPYMGYHTHIVAKVLELLEIDHSLPEQITMSELKVVILENPSSTSSMDKTTSLVLY